MNGKMVNPERISMGEINPRIDLGDLTDLVASIKERHENGQRGVILPLLVRKIEGDEFHDWEIIDGKRRLQSALMIRLPEVPIIDESDEENIIEIKFMSRTSNLYRKDLEWWEDADFYIDMIENHELSAREVARREGVSHSVVIDKVNARKLILASGSAATTIKYTVLREINRNCPDEEKASAIMKATEEDWNEETTIKNLFAVRNFNASQEIVKDFHEGLYNELQEKYYPWRFNPKFMALYHKEKTLKMGELNLTDYYLDMEDYPTRENAQEFATAYGGRVIEEIHRDGWHLQIYPYNIDDLDKKFAELVEKYS